MTCVFCSIVARTTPAEIVLDREHVLAFRDLRPVAPVHVLVIPKKHIAGVHEATPEDAAILGELVLASRDVAESLGVGPSGYRLVVHQGVNAGQSVFHLHCHVIGGRPLSWPPG
jgi:histidine triad (HIT) family protein